MILLVALALVVLVSPGIVGRIAERNFEEGVEWADSGSADLVVTTEKFDRGWFSSEGRHRISLRENELLAALYGDGAAPSLVIDTRFDHGLVPVSSMTRDSGSLKPGLSRMVSTMHLDSADGRLIELPGRFYSETSLTGETTGRYLLEAGSRREDGLAAEWGGADLQYVADPASRMLAVKGEVQPWQFESGGDRGEFGRLSIDARQQQSGFGFNVGDLVLGLDSVAIGGADGTVAGMGKLHVAADSAVEDARVRGRSELTVERLGVPGVGDIDLAMDITVSGLDAASLGRIAIAFREAQAAPDPELALSGMYPVIEDDLETLLQGGGELSFDRLDLTLPQGEVRSRLNLSLPESAGAFSWGSLLLGLKARADLDLPAALVELGRQIDPQAAALVDMGLLRLNGDVYEMRAEYASGLLTVNGAPLPLPLPGQ
ncbi:MAG: DUF945 family protein [Woeseiaceae bacterium]